MKGSALILTGFMGCGKTTVSQILAEKTGRRLIDSDEQIEREQGISISEIFKTSGEAAFREMETGLLKRLNEESFDGILSCGGGMPLREENRELLSRLGTVFYLRAGAEAIAERLSGDSSRPLLAGLDEDEKVGKIRDMLSAREEAYESGADHISDTTGRSPKEVASCILACFQL